MKKIKFIDPPGGWKYGFPKEMLREVTDIRTFLVENGYPQSEIDSLSEYFFVRTWEETEEECKECGKKAELEIMIDSEDPLETPISITDIETNSKINMRLGLCNYPINIYYCKKCFNARL